MVDTRKPSFAGDCAETDREFSPTEIGRWVDR